MKTRQLHPWNVSYHEAIEIQNNLRRRLVFKKLSRNIGHVAGADVSCSKRSNMVWAGVVLEAFKKIKTDPDLILCDGQGIAHPRGLGLASHIGLLTEKPTIGCAKKRLVGEFSEVGRERGNSSKLFYKGKEAGAVVRTRTGVKPLFVSPGYALTIRDAVRMVFNCGGRYRIPEPIRLAHMLVNQLRKREEGTYGS
jgi:deoxyribonuclease V